MKKALIINGSPKTNGNTMKVINIFKEFFGGETEVVNLYAHLSSDNKGCQTCIDCGGCERVKGCIVKDKFQDILRDDFDIIILAFPIFYSNATSAVFNLISRFNFMYNNKKHLGIKHNFKEKTSALIILGGGSACESLQGCSNEDLPIKQGRFILKKLNAPLRDDNIITVLNTDDIKIEDNNGLKEQIKRLTARLG